ncbi:hypothetical protein GGD62_007709 [Bradyrhizobium sp. ERR14]|nr:hypothetical protein [Bradyrhizobium sp. ERR14]NYG45109.1 hypothetical protein [Bradyrhizobium sp. IAR9]
MGTHKDAPLTPKGYGAERHRRWPDKGCSRAALCYFGEDRRQVGQAFREAGVDGP